MHGADVAVRAEVARAVADYVAGGEDAGERFGGDADVGVFLVVFEQDVVARFVGADLGGFEDEGFLLVARYDVVDVGDVAD